MSVFTIVLFLAGFHVFVTNGAPNVKADSLLRAIQADSKSRASVLSAQSQATSSSAVPSALVVEDSAAFPSLPKHNEALTSITANSNGLEPSATTSAMFMPSSTAVNISNNAQSSTTMEPGVDSTSASISIQPSPAPDDAKGTSIGSGIQAYPSEGAPFQNSTSPSEGGGVGGFNGTGTAGSQCQPPVTTTLPRETVTETATAISTVQGPVQYATVTVTTTATAISTVQGPVQYVTVTVTTTATPAPSSPSNAGSLDNTAAIAPSDQPSLTPSNASITASSGPITPASGDGAIATPASHLPPIDQISELPSSGGTESTSAIQLPPVSQTGGPASGSNSATAFSIPASRASILNNVPLYSPIPAGTPIFPQTAFSGGNNASVATGMQPSPSAASSGQFPLQTANGTAPNTSSVPSLAPFQNFTQSSNGTISSNSRLGPSTGLMGSGVSNSTNFSTAPSPSLYQIVGSFVPPSVVTPQPSPSLYQIVGSYVPPSIVTPQPSPSLFQIVGSYVPPSGVTPQITPSPPVNLTNTPGANTTSMDPGLLSPVTSGPIIASSLPTNNYNVQGPPLSPFSTNAACSTDHIMTQNITTDVRSPSLCS